jgi:hypothetical protein
MFKPHEFAKKLGLSVKTLDSLGRFRKVASQTQLRSKNAFIYQNKAEAE